MEVENNAANIFKERVGSVDVQLGKFQSSNANKKRVEELDQLYFDETLPDGFRFRGDWLEFLPPDHKGSEVSPIKICTRIEVVARTRDSNRMNHGRLIKFWDTDGVSHEWAMPMRLFASDGREYRAELLDRGLIISSEKGARTLLGIYIQQSLPELSMQCVAQTGWVGSSFRVISNLLPVSQNKVLLMTLGIFLS